MEPDGEEVSLWSCGELWVLLLLLLPEHLQLLVSKDLAKKGLAQGLARAVRGPWALPLEAQRETLSHILPTPRASCARKGLKSMGTSLFQLFRHVLGGFRGDQRLLAPDFSWEP